MNNRIHSYGTGEPELRCLINLHPTAPELSERVCRNYHRAICGCEARRLFVGCCRINGSGGPFFGQAAGLDLGNDGRIGQCELEYGFGRQLSRRSPCRHVGRNPGAATNTRANSRALASSCDSADSGARSGCNPGTHGISLLCALGLLNERVRMDAHRLSVSRSDGLELQR
jgi:hypothetical protein